jgi:hypothetical protein
MLLNQYLIPSKRHPNSLLLVSAADFDHIQVPVVLCSNTVAVAMNHDVDDYSGGYYPPLAMPDLNYEYEEPPPASNIITRFRSLFSQPPGFDDFDQSESNFAIHAPSLSSKQALVSDTTGSFLDMTSSKAHRFLDVKRILTNITTQSNSTRDRQARTQKPATHSPLESDGFVESAAIGSGFSVISQSRSRSSALTTGNTPPLTPDSCSGLVLSSPIISLPSEELGQRHVQYQEPQQQQYRNSQETGVHIHDEEDIAQRIRERSHLQSVKEGKRPERRIVRCLYTRAEN